MAACLLDSTQWSSVMKNMLNEGLAAGVCCSGLWRSRCTCYSRCLRASKLVRQVGRQIQAQPQSLRHTVYSHAWLASVCLHFSVYAAETRDAHLVCLFVRVLHQPACCCVRSLVKDQLCCAVHTQEICGNKNAAGFCAPSYIKSSP